MPLRLRVGVTRKLGLPSYSSVGASCQIELELDLEPDVLETDLDGFHRVIRPAYVAAHQAVNDQLARLQAPPAPPTTVRHPIEGGKSPGGSRPDQSGPPPSPTLDLDQKSERPATPNQVRAIRNLARGRRADLEQWLGDHDAARPEDLTLAEASRLIDRLRTRPA